MPIFGAELSEVAPKDPVGLAVVDDQYIVAFNRNSSTSGLMPNGAFSVMDTATETARAFTGLATLNTTVVPAAAAVGAGGYAWAARSEGQTVWKVDPSTGTATAVGGGGAGTPDGQGCYVGGSIWMSNTVSLFKFDPTGVAAPVAYNHTAITGGNYLDPVSLAAHTDGWIYGYGGSGYLIGFNPATGTFGKEALSPARGRRFNVVSCDGKLWVPSGEPLT